MAAKSPVSEEYLHTPSMINRLLPAEEHMDIASALSRILWLSLSEGMSTNDHRDRRALTTLASLVAEHTSAAEVALEISQISAKSKGER